MSSISISSPATLSAGSVNWLGTQLIARGGFAVAEPFMDLLAEKGFGGQGPGPVPVPVGPLTCVIQKQNDGSNVASGTVFATATSWWARFGPLTTVTGSTQYQMVATLTTPSGSQKVIDQQLYFNSTLAVSFTGGTGNQFPAAFQVIGNYVPGGNYTVTCYLLNGTTTVASADVQLDEPQVGQWTGSFNVTTPQSNCSLVAEMYGNDPDESVAATWIDGVTILGSPPCEIMNDK
jgi:hypothetical protein